MASRSSCSSARANARLAVLCALALARATFAPQVYTRVRPSHARSRRFHTRIRFCHARSEKLRTLAVEFEQAGEDFFVREVGGKVVGGGDCRVELAVREREPSGALVVEVRERAFL